MSRKRPGSAPTSLSDDWRSAVADRISKPFLFVFQFLRQLETQGYVQLVGMFRIIPRPTLKRLLDAS